MAGFALDEEDDETHGSSGFSFVRQRSAGQFELPAIGNVRAKLLHYAHYGDVVESAAGIFLARNFRVGSIGGQRCDQLCARGHICVN